MILVETSTLMINSIQDIEDLIKLYKEHPPLVAAFDTETTGLSIIEDKPFLYQFGWYNKELDTIFVGILDIEQTAEYKAIIELWHNTVKDAPLYLAHNIKFDLHMLANLGTPYDHDNISDTMFYIRFAHDNVPQNRGGVPLGLKEYCTRYISATAKEHDQQIQVERSHIAKHYNQKLRESLGWTMKRVDEFFKDITNTSEDFPTAVDYLNYLEWLESLPEGIKITRGRVARNDIPYTLVSRDIVIDYAIMDIVWVIKVYLQTWPAIQARQTEEGLYRENECIRPLWEMERQGFTIDQDYVLESFNRMRSYIRRRRQDLIDYTGMEVTANQHKVLLEFFQENGLDIDGTNAPILNRVHIDYPDHPLQPVVDVVLELRTLEKWLSTYLARFLDADKIYTQINQVGAATLRMSSDFQQFPNGGIVTQDGKELFNPRRAIKVPEDCDAIAYVDYSQIELRVQALYTILVGHPDLNLCRAYMPYQCYNEDGVEFDYKNREHIDTAYTRKWFHNEDHKEWHPIDVHGATTKAAFDIDESHPDYPELRDLGKRVNFAKNYGAQKNKIKEMFPDYDNDTIEAIDQGYYTAFPGIRYYQTYCYELGNYQAYATNLFGVRYWNVSGHNLINMLIQGSSATLLKEKIVEVYEFLKPYKTRMLMPIHDEIQFLTYEDELHLLPQVRAIMEDWKIYVPIVADIELTKTYWSEKEDYEIED